MKKQRNLVVLVVVLILVIDQLTKYWVKTNMQLGESFGPGWFLVHFVENEGMAFGASFGGTVGKYGLSLFRLVAIGYLIYLIRQFITKQLPTGLLVCFAMILAGAIGNMIDSGFYGLIFTESTGREVGELVSWGSGYAGFLQGKVVDMLHFPLFDGTFPDWFPVWAGERFEFFRYIFNVADAAISVGVAALLLFYRKVFQEGLV
ncbi:MAG: lipoprotein signal peptidase [Saprospiraceae bacterium]